MAAIISRAALPVTLRVVKPVIARVKLSQSSPGPSASFFSGICFKPNVIIGSNAIRAPSKNSLLPCSATTLIIASLAKRLLSASSSQIISHGSRIF